MPTVYVMRDAPADEPCWVILYESGAISRAHGVEIQGPSTLVYDEELKRHVLKTDAPLKLNEA